MVVGYQARVWQDERFLGLSLDARFILLMLLGHPFMSSFGAIRLSCEACAVEAGISLRKCKAAFSELEACGLVLFEKKLPFIFVTDFLPLPDSVSDWGRQFEALPKCALYDLAMAKARQLCTEAGILDQFEELFEHGKPVPGKPKTQSGAQKACDQAVAKESKGQQRNLYLPAERESGSGVHAKDRNGRMHQVFENDWRVFRVGPEYMFVNQEHIAELHAAFPNIDLELEFRFMRNWLYAGDKSPRDIFVFIANWLERKTRPKAPSQFQREMQQKETRAGMILKMRQQEAVGA